MDKDKLNDKFRMIISHMMLGYNHEEMQKEDWETMLNACVEVVVEHTRTDGWISVEENDPPIKDGRYLVALNRPVVNICHWKNAHWYLGKEDVSKYVTYYMLLPNPPQGDI